MPRKGPRRIPETPEHQEQEAAPYPLFQGATAERHTVVVNKTTIELLAAMGSTAVPHPVGPDQFEIDMDGQVKAVLAELDPDVNVAIQKAAGHQFGTS